MKEVNTPHAMRMLHANVRDLTRLGGPPWPPDIQPRMKGREELAICAQVSLRYETPYLLPWVAYHTLLGFDSIILYIDDGSHLGAIDRSAHSRVLGMLGKAKHITVHSMMALNQTGPGAQMAHCVFTARKHATWMAMWDIDEVPAMGAVPSIPLATVSACISCSHPTSRQNMPESAS